MQLRPNGWFGQRNGCGRRSPQSLQPCQGATNMLRIVIPALALLSLPALARDNGQWGSQPLAVRQWFQSLMQPDHKNQSCCGEADAYEADSFEVEDDRYVAIIPHGKGVIPNGTSVP